MRERGSFLGSDGVLSDEAGFTIIELMMAVIILFIVLTSVGYTATIAFKYVGVARQRETASGYATKYYEEALALPFNAVALGLNNTLDLTYAGDSNIITTSATCSANGVSAPCVVVPGLNNCGSGGSACYEPLQVTSGSTGNACSSSATPPGPTPPLCPHEATDNPQAGSAGSASTYTTDVYVTRPPSTICTSCYRIIVTTRWSNPIDPGAANSVTYQSLMTSTGGVANCNQLSSHPFNGPCGSYLYGQSLIPQGSVTITPNTSGGSGIAGLQIGTATVSLPEDAANSQTSQVTVVQGVATTSSVSLGLGSSTPTLVGGRYLASEADNDATLPDSPYTWNDLSKTPDSSGSVSGAAGSSTTGTTSATACGSTSVNAICLTKSTLDQIARSTVTTGASSSQNPSCNGLNNLLPCGYAVGQAQGNSGCPGNMSTCVVLHLFNGSTDLGTCNLVSVGAPASASSAQVSQIATTTPQAETAVANRNFGQVTVGCIPSNVSPPTSWNLTSGLSGFNPVNPSGSNTGFLAGIRSGYVQTLQAQAGVASPVTSSTGTEWYYSPSTSTVVGGSLSSNLGSTGATLSTLGTLNAALGVPAGGAGTLNAALANSTDTFSALGTLSGAVTSSATTINVTESPAPPGLPFAIRIDSEQMNVTARKTNGVVGGLTCSSTTPCYTVTRAYNGTTAAAHSSGAPVSYRSAVGCPTPCSFNVTETTAPSTATPFVILAGSEQMNVTSRTLVSGSTYTYTAARAYNSTTAATHPSGAAFSEVVSTCPTTCNFDVNESSAPPSTPFTIQIDGEQMNVTARATYASGAPSGCVNSSALLCYSVTRAYNGTTGTTHTSGATVSLVTAGCPSPCSFNVVETSTPPGTPFTIQIGSEQMSVTGRTLVSGSTYTYTVTRAYNGTTATVHSAGATVNFLSIPVGYVTQTDSSASGTPISPTSVNYTTGGCTYKESVTGLTSPSGSVANTTTSGVVTNSAGTMTAPLTADFKFNVTCGANVVADLDINVNLGATKTTATYAPPAQ